MRILIEFNTWRLPSNAPLTRQRVVAGVALIIVSALTVGLPFLAALT